MKFKLNALVHLYLRENSDEKEEATNMQCGFR
jgi:hypothetical protein